ncbi:MULTISPECIES: DUF1800 domain-containing protein [unclassified Brevundimonas]|uniref:DUF1800 domain-containing protein n=1 Tax=unclassified Brevundimonas TaxID=2622653 RepID=UPI003F9231AD
MPSSSDARMAAAIALTRFGLGAGPGEIDAVASDPRGWLTGQIRTEGAPNPAGEFQASTDRVQTFLAYQRAAQGARQVRRANQAEAPQPTRAAGGEQETPAAQAAFAAQGQGRRELAMDTAREFLARSQLGATTKAGFAERWALFWANAFTVSSTKFQAAVFMGQYEREAIRPHVFGRFEDLAVAAETHPAMLLYLDQAQSIGPNSPAGERRQAGLNENLAREIMELHTVGADGGYSQGDVTEFARSLTGWSIANGRDGGEVMRAGMRRGQGARRQAALAGEAGEKGFVFRPIVHEPGARTVMGKRYAEGDAEQGKAVLRDLANRPETARRLARNIARHFVADDPPPALVGRLETAWMGSRGDLAQVAKALIEAPEAWAPRPEKIKTPYEFVVSTHRALGTRPQRPQPLQQALQQMGQPAFQAPSPEGWPDTADDWAGPDALVKRLNWAKGVGDAAQIADPNIVAAAALGPRLGERSRLAVARAESRAEALTLLLMSPEFQRR